jgi:hypothetical protein
MADKEHRLGSAPHDLLPLAIAKKISILVKDLVRRKAGEFVLRNFLPPDAVLHDNVVNLIKDLGVGVRVGVDAAAGGSAVAVRLRLGDSDPEIELRLEG